MSKPSTQSFREINRFVVVMFFVLLLCLGGCRSTQLKTLESLVSIISPTTGREVSRYVQEKERGFTGPVYAEIFIEYEPLDGYTQKELYDEIVAILADNHWEGEVCEGCGQDSFSASLQQGNYPIPITARVRIHPGENIVSIRMTHPQP